MSTSVVQYRRSFKSDPKLRLPIWQEKLFIARTRNAADATRVYRLPTSREIKLGQRPVSCAAGAVRHPERRPVFMRFCTIWLHDAGNHRNFRRCCFIKGPIVAGGASKVASGHRQPFVRHRNGAG